MNNIVILGDLLPTDINQEMFCDGEVEKIVDKNILDLLQNSSMNVANLEGCLTDSEKYIDKSGPVLKSSTKSIQGIRKLGINVVSLANNHIMDYGREGLLSTINILNQNDISYFGAGESINEARKSFVFEVSGKKIGIYSCAEYEFTIATEKKAGANPFDEIYSFDDVERLKKDVDFLIVLYHGGKEYYEYPIPYVQRRCRHFIDKGANLVICQHSHCIGCCEEYKNAKILYGQGNFLMNRPVNNPLRNSGLIVKVSIDDYRIEFIPIVKNERGVELADDRDKNIIMSEFKKRCEQIKDPLFVEKEYQQFAFNMLLNYEIESLGVFGKILKKLKLHKLIYIIRSKNNKLWMLNTLRCEAHRDLYITGLLDVDK